MRRRDLQIFKKLLLREKGRIVKKMEEVVSEDLIEQNNKPADEADIS